MSNNKKPLIVLAGGGTGGSVTPLLALAEILENKNNFLFIGTSSGPEWDLLSVTDLPFKVVASGKLRRYFSWQNFADPFRIIIGFFQSLVILIKNRPRAVVSAGGFVAVPVAYAAWILRIPIFIHQQDVLPGLANKLMAPFAKVITVVFQKSLDDYGSRAQWIGNPVKKFSFDIDTIKDKIFQKFGLDSKKPLLLAIGGGTGSLFLNKIVSETVLDLSNDCQVIHITGKDRGVLNAPVLIGYRPFTFLDHDEVLEIMAASDLVVSRCGLGTLSELTYLRKPSLLIPMADSHQEDNASVFAKAGAALVLHEETLTPEIFLKEVKGLLNNETRRFDFINGMSNVMKPGAAEAWAEIIGKNIK